MKKLILTIALLTISLYPQSKLLLLMGDDRYTPKNISGLTLWLKYDDAVLTSVNDSISLWTDLSDSNNNFSTNVLAERPIKRNYGVDFNSTGELVIAQTVNLEENHTIIMVMREKQNSGVQVYLGGRGGLSYFGRVSPLYITYRDFASNQLNFTIPFTSDSICVFEFDRTGTSVMLYRNNVFIATQELPDNSRFDIQTISGFPTFKANFVLNELIAYDHPLTQSERGSLYNKYINKKTYKRYVHCEGNSITYGTGSGVTLPYPTQLQTLLGNSYFVKNSGYPGASVLLLKQYALSTADPFYTHIGGQSILVFEGGLNDLEDSTLSVDTVYNRIKSYCLARKTAGYKVITTTITQRQTPSNTHWESDRAAINNLIRTNWATFADALCDFDADPRLATYSATYFSDGVHPNDAGYGVMAELVYAIIKDW